MTEQAQKPKLGTRLPIEPCPICGGEQYEEYRAWPVYHNDVEYGWEKKVHLESYRPSYTACLQELVKRIKSLETRMDEQKENNLSEKLKALLELAGSVICTACGYTLAEHPIRKPEIVCDGRSPGGTEDWTEEIQLIKSFESWVN